MDLLGPKLLSTIDGQLRNITDAGPAFAVCLATLDLLQPAILVNLK